MAKRPSDDIDPFDDPFDNEIDDSDIENLRIPDADDPFDSEIDDTDISIDDEDAPKRPKESTGYRPRPTTGQIIVGAIQVIFVAAIFLAIFLALGFGAVFGGQKVGLVPTRAPGGTGPLLALLPTAGAAQPNGGNQPTAAPQGAPTSVPTLAATTDASCSKAADWWNDPQVQSAYQYFAGQALNDARSSDKVPALLVQMKIRRDFVANYQPGGKPLDPCLGDAQAALLRGFDATIEAARAIGANDATALATQQDNATKAYQDMAAALGKFGVSVNLTPVPPTPAS